MSVSNRFNQSNIIITKRPRGRPKKVQNQALLDKEIIEIIPVKKSKKRSINELNNDSPGVQIKKRGRPKKVKNQALLDEEIIEIIPVKRSKKETYNIQINEFNNNIKRKRGRPRKNPLESNDSIFENNLFEKQNIISKSISNPNKSFENNQNKTFINSIFATEIIKLIINNKHKQSWNLFVGVLDGLERNTSNTLLSMGFEKNSILIVEDKKSIADSHVRKGFCTHHGKLSDFASDYYDKEYNKDLSAWRKYDCYGWYFDTCGTISTQKKGIIETIKKSQLINGVILGFTFCRSRMTNNTFEIELESFLVEINDILGSKGLRLGVQICKHDYTGQSMWKRARESHMCSLIYKTYQL